jgi:hypothetical protein
MHTVYPTAAPYLVPNGQPGNGTTLFGTDIPTAWTITQESIVGSPNIYRQVDISFSVSVAHNYAFCSISWAKSDFVIELNPGIQDSLKRTQVRQFQFLLLDRVWPLSVT